MSTPARLDSKQTQTFSEKIDIWAISHQTIILSFCFISFGILVIILAYSIVGVSATESGGLRNFLIRGI